MPGARHIQRVRPKDVHTSAASGHSLMLLCGMRARPHRSLGQIRCAHPQGRACLCNSEAREVLQSLGCQCTRRLTAASAAGRTTMISLHCRQLDTQPDCTRAGRWRAAASARDAAATQGGPGGGAAMRLGISGIPRWPWARGRRVRSPQEEIFYQAGGHCDCLPSRRQAYCGGKGQQDLAQGGAALFLLTRSFFHSGDGTAKRGWPHAR